MLKGLVVIKLKNIVKEILEDQLKDIDVDRLMWNDSYLDDIAEKLGYESDFNKTYWNYLYREPMYHCTEKENLPSIQQKGLLRKDIRRGITNRNIGAAVFACPEEEVDYFKNYYGPIVIKINTSQMKSDNYVPHVEREPDWMRAEMLAFVLNKLGQKRSGSEREASEFVDSSDGNTQGTIIFYDNIPPKYLSVVEGIEMISEIEGYDPIMELKGEVKRLELDLNVEFPQLSDLHIYLRSGGDLYLNSLRVKPNERGKGIGHKVMERIIDFADKHNLYLTLHPVPEPRYKAKLQQFYKK